MLSLEKKAGDIRSSRNTGIDASPDKNVNSLQKDKQQVGLYKQLFAIAREELTK
jgi:hypothetical protein